MQEICRHDWRKFKGKTDGEYKPFEENIARNIPSQGSVSFHHSFFRYFLTFCKGWK